MVFLPRKERKGRRVSLFVSVRLSPIYIGPSSPDLRLSTTKSVSLCAPPSTILSLLHPPFPSRRGTRRVPTSKDFSQRNLAATKLDFDLTYPLHSSLALCIRLASFVVSLAFILLFFLLPFVPVIAAFVQFLILYAFILFLFFFAAFIEFLISYTLSFTFILSPFSAFFFPFVPAALPPRFSSSLHSPNFLHFTFHIYFILFFRFLFLSLHSSCSFFFSTFYLFFIPVTTIFSPLFSSTLHLSSFSSTLSFFAAFAQFLIPHTLFFASISSSFSHCFSFPSFRSPLLSLSLSPTSTLFFLPRIFHPPRSNQLFFFLALILPFNPFRSPDLSASFIAYAADSWTRCDRAKEQADWRKKGGARLG